jgi:hypothetical protein
MTNEELQEIERTWKTATPGPWRAVTRNEDYPEHDGEFAAEVVRIVDAVGEPVVQQACHYVNTADARAIARAPEHIATLLAEVKRLRERETAVERVAIAQTLARVESWLARHLPVRNVVEHVAEKNRPTREDFSREFGDFAMKRVPESEMELVADKSKRADWLMYKS